MGKRRANKPSKSKPKNKSPIKTTAARKRLAKELKNARARIRGMISSMGDSYTGPRVEDFYLKNVEELIHGGVHINTIYAMIRNTTASKINKRQKTKKNTSDPIVAELYGGSPVKQSQYSRLMKATAKANKNIEDVINKYPDAEVILPTPLNPNEILRKVVKNEKLDELIDVIGKAFTPAKLLPTAINDDGEAGTKAEIEYLNYFIKNENKKRENAREHFKDVIKHGGRFRTQQEFDTEPINTDRFESMSTWRRRAEFYTDAKEYNRAGLWLGNYYKSILKFSDTMRSEHGYGDESELQKMITAIIDMIEAIDDPETVRKLTYFSDSIAIAANYIGTLDNPTEYVHEIYEAWTNFQNGGFL